MPKLWTFGDSFTKGHGMNGEIPEYKNADENLRWNVLLANQLGYELQNLGDNGLPNEMILHSIINCLNKFEKDDIVIIQSSTMGRMVVPEQDSEYDNLKISPVYIHQNTILDEPEIYLKHFNKDELNSIINFFQNFILDGFYYSNEVKSIINLANYLNNNNIVKKIIYWNLFPIESSTNFSIKEIYKDKSDLDKIYLKNRIKIDTYKYGWMGYFKKENMTIAFDTNNKIKDLHLSKNGHNLFFRILLNQLKLETKNNFLI